MTNNEAPKEFCTNCGKDLGYSRHFTCLACRQKPCTHKNCKIVTASKTGKCHKHYRIKTKPLDSDTGAFVVENIRTGFVYPIRENKK